MNNSILIAIIAAWGLTSNCEAGEFFHKELPGKFIVSVSQSEPSKPHLLREDRPPSASDTNPITVTEVVFVLKLQMLPTNQVEEVWTNRHAFLHGPADPLVTAFHIFDATLDDDEHLLQLCYQDGPFFRIEEISSRLLGSPQSNLSRFELARMHIMPSWAVITNAFFGFVPLGLPDGGVKTLTAQAHNDTVLVWQFQNDEWLFSTELSRPENVKRRIRDNYKHFISKSNQWVPLGKASP